MLTIDYDHENMKNEDIRSKCSGEITLDRYGREVPKYDLRTLEGTSSAKALLEAMLADYFSK